MEKIAEFLTKFIIAQNNHENLDFEVYKFGLLMALEVGMNLMIALFISSALGMFGYGILFLVFFSLLRAFAGGIHLNSFLGCTILSSSVLIAILFLVKYVNVPAVGLFVVSLVASILIFILGPVDDKNRRISEEEHNIFYRRLTYTLIFLGIISALSIILGYNRLTFMICLTLGLFHIVQIIGKNKNLKYQDSSRRYKGD